MVHLPDKVVCKAGQLLASLTEHMNRSLGIKLEVKLLSHVPESYIEPVYVKLLLSVSTWPVW